MIEQTSVDRNFVPDTITPDASVDLARPSRRRLAATYERKALAPKPKLHVRGRFNIFYIVSKRLFDIVASLLAIILLAVPMLVVGLLVKLTSRGPMLYVSDRVGKGGRVFRFYKFRSMYQDADQRLDELLKYNEVAGGVTFKMKDDPRITPFGRFIRKTSLDELPQLFNILKNDMTFVGPRPGTVRERALYSPRDEQRLLVKQGLTGEWQVHGRSTTTFDQMIDMDLDYIENKRGFFYDLKLIFKTFSAVFKRDGAE